MKPCCIVKNLTKSYQGRTVVDHLSFTVYKQEVFGLLGHNGAGKSTTIETMLGLKKADCGEVEILGKIPARNRKELFEHIGVQLQASNYQNNIRVDEICQELSLLYQNPRDYHVLLKKFGLEALKHARVDKLSGGEKQKLSVVLALLPNPELIFLDELTTGLDTAARREVWKIIASLKEEGTTIFLTTHYMEEAQHLCDRICLLRNGRKLIEGTLDDVISRSPYTTLEEAYLWFMEEEQ